MKKLDYLTFDADNHYYEPIDSFTRYQDKSMQRRGVRIVRDGKRVFVVVADKVNRFIPNPTFDPIIVPGCIELFFRGQVPDDVDPATLMKLEPLSDVYQNRDKRLTVMDEQGLGEALLFPTLGVGIEEGLKDDPEAAAAALTSFNKWLEEDWGFAYKDRIYGIPLITLADPDLALKEIDSLLDRGAKGVHIRPAPVPSKKGPRSLGHPAHDPVWARIAEANLPVFFHLGDSGYASLMGQAWGGANGFEAFGQIDPFDQVVVDDRAIHDTMASLIAHGVFHRHPGVRVASIENGSEWVYRLVKRLRKRANQHPSLFPDDPLDVLRNHVWISPYYEEDLHKLSDFIGVDKILFGSDWPHGEGLAQPNDFIKELDGFSDDDIHLVMRENVLKLLHDDDAAEAPAALNATGRQA